MSRLAEIRDSSGKLPRFADGGYPLVYIVDDGESLCADCVNDPSNPIHEQGDADGWRVEGYQVHWEGPPETCAHCGAEIQSAYGDPDSPEPEESDGYVNEPAYGDCVVSLDGRMIRTAASVEEGFALLARAMRDSCYWPNVWHVNERGNTILVVIEDFDTGTYRFTDVSSV